MSIISKISLRLTEFKNKIHIKPEKIASQKMTSTQPFLNSTIQPHDAFELTSDKFEEMNSQIQDNLFEEKKENPQLPKLSFLA